MNSSDYNAMRELFHSLTNTDDEVTIEIDNVSITDTSSRLRYYIAREIYKVTLSRSYSCDVPVEFLEEIIHTYADELYPIAIRAFLSNLTKGGMDSFHIENLGLACYELAELIMVALGSRHFVEIFNTLHKLCADNDTYVLGTQQDNQAIKYWLRIIGESNFLNLKDGELEDLISRVDNSDEYLEEFIYTRVGYTEDELYNLAYHAFFAQTITFNYDYVEDEFTSHRIWKIFD